MIISVFEIKIIIVITMTVRVFMQLKTVLWSILV